MALSLHDSAVAALQRSSVRYSVKIDLIRNDQTVISTEDGKLRAVSGAYSSSSARDIKAEFSFNCLIDEQSVGLVPVSSSDLLSPVSSTYVRFSHGVMGLDGVFHYVQVGEFEIAESDIDDSGGALTLSVQSFDSFRGIDRGKFTEATTIAAGTNYATAIQTLISAVFPGATYSVISTPHVTPLLTYDVGDSRLKAILDMATSIGYEIRVDRSAIEIIPLVVPDDPHWIYAEGSNARILSARRRISDDTAHNGVIFRGESFSSDTAPVQADAWDTNPLSPTYSDPANPLASTYGPYPHFETSEYITTELQAQDAADAKLPSVMGATEVVEIETQTNPAVQYGDLCSLTRARAGISGLFTVESVAYNLEPGTMRIGMRERRLV
jgi:hypothetical protein